MGDLTFSAAPASHKDITLRLIDRWEGVKDGHVTVEGEGLSIAEIYAVAHNPYTKVSTTSLSTCNVMM